MSESNYIFQTCRNSIMLLLVFAFIFSHCSRNEVPETPSLSFHAQTENTTWSNGDRIGVFAIGSGASLTQNNIIDYNNNLPFITNGNNVFQPQVKNIYHPEDGTAMDIIAYYPFITSLTDFYYPINISTQTNFLYSNNLTGVRKAAHKDNHLLQFTSPLSTLEIIVSGLNSEDISRLSAVLRGTKTKARFSLADGTLSIDENSVADLPLIVVPNEGQRGKIMVLMLPTTATEDFDIEFRINHTPNTNSGSVYTYILTVNPLEANKAFTYNIVLNSTDFVEDGDGGGIITPPPPIVPTPFMYMEIPIFTNGITQPNTIEIRHYVQSNSWLNNSVPLPSGAIRNYAVLYDTANRLPVWVAYPLHPMYLSSGNRTDAWQFDPQIASNLQPDLQQRSWRSLTSELFDRGHVLPSADRDATRALNATTFYFTNVVIQNRSMNQGTWENLESQVRRWSSSRPNDTIYVVSGQILYDVPRFDALDNNGVPSAKPAYMYKALLRRSMTTGAFTSIGFKMENENNSRPHTERVVSVLQLEQETGLTFFPTLPENIAETVKGNTVMGNF